MTTLPAPAPSSGPALLRYALEHPHEAALAALHDPEVGSLAAVTWAATHLAAVTRVLHPLARRTLPHGRSRLRVVVDADRRLQRALWRLDRRLTGDVHGSTQEVAALEAAVAVALAEHARHETALVDELVRQLPESEQGPLAVRIGDAVRRAPTRPHPDAPVAGAAAGLAYRLDAGADHLRDLFDNRSVPTPHDERVPQVPGRWGAYVMGQPFPRRPD